MATNPYSNLGWDPVPGTVGEVSDLHRKIRSSATSLRSTHTQIQKLIGESSYWQGDAATAFRDSLDGDLPTYLKNAARSLEKASAQLSSWHGILSSHRELAKKYDDVAGDKHSALVSAKDAYGREKKNPDLNLGGKTYPSEAEADDATARLQAANRELASAAAAVTSAQESYENVIKKAEELESTHVDEARKIAKSLDEATDKLAPKEPGLLSKMVQSQWEALKLIGGFIYEHIGTIGAIAGLLALIPTPLSPLLAGVAVAASAVALAKDVTEKWGDLTTPGWDMDTFSAYASVAGDAVGLIPGVGAVAKAGGETVFAAKLAGEAGGAMSASAKAGTFTNELVPAFSAASHQAAAGAKVTDYTLGTVNAGANVVSDLEEAGKLPDDGAGHNANEGVKAGLAGKDAIGGIGGLAQNVGDLGAAIRL